MLHEVEHGRRDKVLKKLEVKLKEYMDAFNESQRLLHSLQQDEKKCEKILVDVHTEEKKVFVERDSLQDSLNVTLLRKKDLDKDVPELTDEVVSASGVYFKCSKEQVPFLYPNLDFSLLDFQKVMREGGLVDEETMSYTKNHASIEENHGHDGKT